LAPTWRSVPAPGTRSATSRSRHRPRGGCADGRLAPGVALRATEWERMAPELCTYGWWIETDRFRNAPTEERAVNPGRYGEGLATFVAERLASRGWTVASIGPEDWGWLVELAAEGRTLRVTCGNEDGSVVRWCVGPVARGS